MLVLGFDIGGSKCAVITAKVENGEIEILKKEKCSTDHTISPRDMINKLMIVSIPEIS